jgi:hypothetical protein
LAGISLVSVQKKVPVVNGGQGGTIIVFVHAEETVTGDREDMFILAHVDP